MKRILSLLGVLGMAVISNAQETTSTTNEYDKLSVEFNLGLNKAVNNWETQAAPTNLKHFDLAARYMLNTKFGFKGSFGFDRLKNDEGNANYKTNIYRYSLEGVLNVGRILEFEDWTGKVGLLLHAGGGLTHMSFNTMGGRSIGASHLMLGITPQVRITDRIAVTADFTAINNFQQEYTFDGYNRDNGVITGTGTVVVDNHQGTTTVNIADPSQKFLKHVNPILNASIGVTYYIGSRQKHADWYATK